MTEVRKVCPTELELCSQQSGTNVPCPVAGCDKILPRKTNLWMHMTKVHRIVQPQTGPQLSTTVKTGGNVTVHYHCPRQGCIYNPDSERHFNCLKNLKQHYMTVHAEKKFKCPTCGTGFGLEGALRRHAATCGHIFKCDVCKCPYSTRESLLTHCRRTLHPIPEKYRKTPLARPVVPVVQTICTQPAVATAAAGVGPASAPGTACSPEQYATSTQPQNARSNAGCSSQENQPSPGQNLHAKTAVCAGTKSQPWGPTAVGGQSEPAVAPFGSQASNDVDAQAEPSANMAEVEASTMTGEVPGTLKATEQKKIQPTILPKPNMLLVSLNPQMQPSQIFYIADASLRRAAPERPIAIAPKPSRSQTSSSAPSGESLRSCALDLSLSKKTREIQTDPVKVRLRSKQPAHKMTMSTQTSLSHRRINVAQTQTTGDFILKQAMHNADIPTRKESKGSQVSPRAKLKRAHVQSSHTQTIGNQRSTRKRQRKSDQHDTSSAAASTYHQSLFPTVSLAEVAASTPGLLTLASTQGTVSQASTGTFTNIDGPMSNNETQTLLEELEATLAESISTQTLESYLADSGDGQMLDCSGQRQHSGVQTHCSLIGNQPEEMQTADQSVLCSLDFASPNTPPSAGLFSDRLSLVPYNTDTSLASASNMLTDSDSNQATNSKSQQTVEFSLDALTDGDMLSTAETQTSSSDLDISSLLNTSSSHSQTMSLISYMHMETQTGNDEGALQDFFNNMHTQTSDEYLTNLSFSDIETQTSLNAVETQTLSLDVAESDVSALGIMDDITGDQNCSAEMSASAMTAQTPVKASQMAEGIQTGLSSSQSETKQATLLSSNHQGPVPSASATVETQTSVQHLQGLGPSLAPSTDTETQTLFPGLDLGPDLTDSHTQTSLQDLMSFVSSLQ